MRMRMLTMWILLGSASLWAMDARAEAPSAGQEAEERQERQERQEPRSPAKGAEGGELGRVERGGGPEIRHQRAPEERDDQKAESKDEAPGEARTQREPARAQDRAQESAPADGQRGEPAPSERSPAEEPSASGAPKEASARDEQVEVDVNEPAPVLAELFNGEIPDGARTITLPDAIELALRRHPRLGAADSEVRAAEARLRQSRSSYYPKVDVWLEALRASMNPSQAVYHSVPGMPRLGGSAPAGVEATGSYNQFLAAATVHQLLYDFGRTQGDVGAQKAMVEAARMNHELIGQSVIFEVTRAFYAVLRRRAERLVAQEGVRRSLRIHELARSGVEAGLRPPSESARAEADVARAELEEIQARAELDIARVQFANTLGGAPDGPLEPVGGRDFSRSMIGEDEAVASALKNRPELRAFAFRETELRERVRSVRGAHFPRLEAIFGMSSRGMFLNSGEPMNHAANNWNVGVVMHVPIFQGMRVSAQVDELEAEILALEANREVIHQAVLLEVKRTIARVRSTDEAVRAAEKGLRAARLALDTTEGRYRSGLANIVEMTDAQSTYIGAVSAALSASYEQILAFARLRLAMGQLGKGEGGPIPASTD